MNKYAIITPEGYCTSPNDTDVCNCQFLGRIAAEDKEQAIEKFWEENDWLETSELSIREAIAIQLHESEPV